MSASDVLVTLVSYPPARRAAVVKTITRITSFTMSGDDLVSLPLQVGCFLPTETGVMLFKSLSAIGAEVRIDPFEPNPTSIPSARNVLHHPAFGNPPVKNPKRRGPKKGTISLNSERRRRYFKKLAEDKERREPKFKVQERVSRDEVAMDTLAARAVMDTLAAMKPHLNALLFVIDRLGALQKPTD